MIDSLKNKATVSILDRLKKKGMPSSSAQMSPVPAESWEEGLPEHTEAGALADEVSLPVTSPTPRAPRRKKILSSGLPLPGPKV